MAKTSKPTGTPTSKPTSKPSTDKPVILNYTPKGIIKEGYQPTNTVDTSNPPKQNTSDKKE
jgi:hypothetical protein